MIELPYQVNERFRLIGELGSGNWSEVFLAEDLEPDIGPARVAFKLFRDSGQHSSGLVQTLSAFEFQMLSRLRHPNLAEVYDYGVDPATGRAFFTMERISGVDFLEAVSNLPPLETLPLVVETCRALHHIHTRGLIHHDLKPGNLIVTNQAVDSTPLDRQRVKLTDFGLSKPVPAFLEDLVGRLLEADPDLRYQTANDVIRDLGLYTGTRYDLEPGAVGASSLAADTVLTITGEQLDGLRQRLKRLGSDKTGHCRPALVIGGPGSGKSQLIMELRRMAQTSGAGFVFFPTADGNPDDLVRRLLERSAAGLVLIIDAEEHGPDTVARILRQTGQVEGLLVVVTASRDLPLDPCVERITIRPLDLELTARYLSRLLGSPVPADDPLTRQVQAESDGLPQLVEETVAHLHSCGLLTLAPAGPSFHQARFLVDFTPPTGHLLSHHRPAAARAESAALGALAVFGAPATVRQVTSLAETDTGGDETERTLTEATGTLLVSEETGGERGYRYRSLLSRNLVYHRLDQTRRKEFHRRAAADEAAGALTWRHLMLAGDSAGAWQQALNRGEELEDNFQWDEASEVYETLLAHGDSASVAPETVVALHLKSANLLRAAGLTDDARSRFNAGLAIARSTDHREQRARLRLGIGILLEKEGELETAEKLYRTSLEELPPAASPVRGELLRQLGLNSLLTGRHDEAEACVDQCRSAYGNSSPRQAEESCLFLESYTLHQRQKPDELVARVGQWLETAGRERNSVTSGLLRVLLGEIHYCQGRFDEADRLFGEGMEIFSLRGERALKTISLTNRGAMHFEQGRFSTASRYNLDALRAHEQMGNRSGQAQTQYNLGVCDYHRGRYDDALDHLRTARAIYEYLADTQGLAQCINMEAELHLTLGDTDLARQRLDSSLVALPPGDTGYTAADRLLLEAELTLLTGEPQAAEPPRLSIRWPRPAAVPEK